MSSVLEGVRRSVRGLVEGDEKLVYLLTKGTRKLVVLPGDPVFQMAMDLVAGYNPLLLGPTGGGKTSRAQALLEASNYVQLLAGTKWQNIEVEIHSSVIDMTTVVVSSELIYDCNITKGTSSKDAVNLAEFVLTHGFRSRRELVAQMEKHREVLKTGRGKITIYGVYIDDFDRIPHPSLQNALMKSIEDHFHVYPWNGKGREFYLNLQCVATSNSTYGDSSGRYIAAAGIDEALRNRFFSYHIGDDGTLNVLRSEFDPNYHSFIMKLVSLVSDTRKAVSEGSLSSLGEVSLRQLRGIVEQVAFAGLPEEQGARKLFSGLNNKSDESEAAEELMNRYFGTGRSKKRTLSFT